MSFKREKIRDIYLLTTEVENIFINEYMPQAPGDYVKVYLYGLLYSGNGEAMTEKQMSRQLGLPGRKDRSGMGLLGETGSCEPDSFGRHRRI